MLKKLEKTVDFCVVGTWKDIENRRSGKIREPLRMDIMKQWSTLIRRDAKNGSRRVERIRE